MVWHGIAHVAGKYPNRAAQADFFTYGANLIKNIGPNSKAIKFYLTGGYSTTDYLNQGWNTPTTLKALAQTTTVAAVLNDSQFTRIIMTTYSFTNGTQNPWVYGITKADLDNEYTETYDLASHLLSTYSNKHFIIQNWEGDYGLLNSFTRTALIPDERLRGYTAFYRERQRAINNARRDVTSSATISHCLESALVLDDFGYRLHRNVAPRIKPDMLSTSIYEAISQNQLVTSNQALSESNIASSMSTVFSRMRKSNPNIPIIIGEYGWPQDDWFAGYSLSVASLIQKVIDVADSHTVSGVIWWQILDNEEISAGVPRGYGLYNRNGSSTVVGALNAAGNKYAALLA